MSALLWQQRAVDIAAGLRGKKFSCSEVMASVVDRIRAVNPKPNAIVTDLTEQALREAADATPVLRETAEWWPVYDESTQ
jgi:amidase